VGSLTDFLELTDPTNLAGLAESTELECKAAQGKDGQGEVPKSFWETYSAMANMYGGEIILGIEEKPKGSYRILGVRNPDRVKKQLWDDIHNKNNVNIALLQDRDIEISKVEDKTVIRVRIPRATRQQRPVHLGANPFGNTFVRRHESDYRLDDEAVRRMLAERVEDARDAVLIAGFSVRDLDRNTIDAYRNRFAAVSPGHIWADDSPADFLEKIGAIGRDRSTGSKGLTLAGLLMFGRFEAIRDATPNYMVDYQERPEPLAERRWVDRIVPDGTWPGNLYEFFHRVYLKLTTDLKVPFNLQSGQRINDTPVHEALREALVNTLIHCDFSGRASVLVVKRPDMFGFRNPGLMRVPIEQALRGGVSDCRNRRLQAMFRFVGYGDHAGSGIPKIYSFWAKEHWRAPALYERQEPEQTLMELRMENMFPPEVVDQLTRRFGDRFKTLPELERTALVTAACEKTIHHARLRSITANHARDITKALMSLSRDGLLESDGSGRGTVYFLPGSDIERPDDVFGGAAPIERKDQRVSVQRSEGFKTRSGGLAFDSEGLKIIVQDFARERFANEVLPRKLPKPVMRELICTLCEQDYLPLRALAEILDRSSDFLRQSYLNPMVKDRLLELKYPTTPNHQAQSYHSIEGWQGRVAKSETGSAPSGGKPK